jgi:hypothetical protein
MRSVPACDALRGVSTILSVVRGWLVSGALDLAFTGDGGGTNGPHLGDRRAAHHAPTSMCQHLIGRLPNFEIPSATTMLQGVHADPPSLYLWVIAFIYG